MGWPMFGLPMLLAASIAPAAPALPPAGRSAGGFQPTSSVTAQATVSIRVVSGVRFGQDQLSGAETASRRNALIRGPDGLVRPAELLEFQ